MGARVQAHATAPPGFRADPELPPQPLTPADARELGWAFIYGFVGPMETPSKRAAETLGADLKRQTPRAMLLRVVEKAECAFDARAGAVEIVPLADQLDSTAFATAVLVVRLHEAPTWASVTASASVKVFNASVDAAAPETPFEASSAIASVAIANGVAAPQLYVDVLDTPIAASLRVILEWSQGSRESTAQERLAISVELLGRR